MIQEGILEAAKAITRASGALVNAASATQKELMIKGKGTHVLLHLLE